MAIKIRPSARIGDYDRGVAAERERIIALIPEHINQYRDWETDCQIDLEMLIVLIKGENK